MSLYFMEHNVQEEEDSEQAYESTQAFYEEYMRQLTEEFLNPTKPVSKQSLRALPVHFVREEHLSLDPCTICQEAYQLDELIVRLPCKHIFHKDCVFKWFEKENACCLCRFELESDNSEYEASKIDKEEQRKRNLQSMYI